MPEIRKIAMAGGTFAVALGIGFVMQNGDVLAARFATDDELRAAQAQVQSEAETQAFIVLDAEPEPAAPDAGTESAQMSAAEPGPDASPALPDLPQPALASSVLPSVGMGDAPVSGGEAPVQMAAAEPDPLPGATTDTPLLSGELDCVPEMTATVGAAAMVRLDVSAPCHTQTRGTLHHQGMMFTFVTDDSGKAALDVPALAENAIFIADVTGGEGALAMVDVPEVALYDRAVLQWQGDAGLELHAREFGADYGSEGHVWKEEHREAAHSSDGAHGFLTRLGDRTQEQALMAEVYTFPSGMAARSGSVALSAEIAITASNCGQDIAAQSLQIAPGADPVALDLTLSMPGCEDAGDFIVLQNMFEDLTLASR